MCWIQILRYPGDPQWLKYRNSRWRTSAILNFWNSCNVGSSWHFHFKFVLFCLEITLLHWLSDSTWWCTEIQDGGRPPSWIFEIFITSVPFNIFTPILFVLFYFHFVSILQHHNTSPKYVNPRTAEPFCNVYSEGVGGCKFSPSPTPTGLVTNVGVAVAIGSQSHSVQ